FTGRYSYLLYFHTLKSCFLHTSPKYRSIPDFYLVGIKIVDLFRNYLNNIQSPANLLSQSRQSPEPQ
ncbi:MAG: hypothetical protein E7244_00960, partial [Enterocloster citroniae]|nr:hypothetical protein [Enterocloster citroniae]